MGLRAAPAPIDYPLVPAVGDEKMEIDGRLCGGERLCQRASVVQIIEGADRKICNAIGQEIRPLFPANEQTGAFWWSRGYFSVRATAALKAVPMRG